MCGGMPYKIWMEQILRPCYVGLNSVVARTLSLSFLFDSDLGPGLVSCSKRSLQQTEVESAH